MSQRRYTCYGRTFQDNKTACMEEIFIITATPNHGLMTTSILQGLLTQKHHFYYLRLSQSSISSPCLGAELKTVAAFAVFTALADNDCHQFGCCMMIMNVAIFTRSFNSHICHESWGTERSLPAPSSAGVRIECVYGSVPTAQIPPHSRCGL